jgi:hypothetical protein
MTEVVDENIRTKLLNNATDGKEIIDVELIKPTPEQTNCKSIPTKSR